MNQKNFIKSASIIFLLIGIVHLLRVIYEWRVRVDAYNVPMWASIVAVVVAAYLSYQGFRMSR